MIISDLPFPKKIGLKKVIDYQVLSILFLDQWMVPSGTIVKLATTQNFGMVVLPEGCRDVRGFEIPRRIFRL